MFGVEDGRTYTQVLSDLISDFICPNLPFVRNAVASLDFGHYALLAAPTFCASAQK
jgi:hypothetical protein